MAKKPRVDTQSSDALTSSPFAGLAGLQERVDDPGPDEVPPQVPVSDPASSGWDPTRTAKAVVRREKKGRGGKTATVVEGLQASPGELDALAQRLRKELGCGSRAEGALLVVQGEQTARVCEWLRALGVRRVIAGN